MADHQTEPSQTLELGPSVLYRGKAAYTRARSVWWLVRARGQAAADGARILFYHRVCEDADELGVTPARFHEQMSYLAANGYRAVDVAELSTLLQGGGPLSGTVGLSFDDGYADIAEHALPVLEAVGFRATVFVATDVVDGAASFSWYRTQPPLLSWDEIVRLDRAGTFRFEAHTRTHPNLLALSDEAAREEIAGSKLSLERRLGRPSSVFCYPAGLFGPRERRLVVEAGFASAVTCEPGINRRGDDLFTLQRRQIDRRDNLLDFRAKLSGGHDTAPPLRGRYRRRFDSDAA